MAVVKTEGFSGAIKHVAALYISRLRLVFSGYSQLLCCSFLFSYSSFSYAGPTGGNIVGGTGSINQSSLNTVINQTTSSMAINWGSYNVNANERVQYIQPDSSSISLTLAVSPLILACIYSL